LLSMSLSPCCRFHPAEVNIRIGQSADSDDLARVYRFDLAQDSEMISPTVPI
jgi:hypothetical protein